MCGLHIYDSGQIDAYDVWASTATSRNHAFREMVGREPCLAGRRTSSHVRTTGWELGSWVEWADCENEYHRGTEGLGEKCGLGARDRPEW